MSTGSAPAIALGTMNFGKRTDAAESERIIARALEHGVRVFDTANVYNDGESERIVGRALGRHRGDAIVATKVGLARVDGKPEGLSRSSLLRAVDASLQRLGTDFIDLYYLHAPDHRTPVEETLDAMLAIVRAGKVRAWGISNYASWQIVEMTNLATARGLSRPACSQVIYNVLHRQLEIEHFAFARHAGLHVTVYNPLAGGLLTGRHRFEAPPDKHSRFDANPMYAPRYWTRAMFDRVNQLSDVARSESCSLPELAYAWVASRSDVDSILVGPASVAQLDQALDATRRVLPASAITRIDELAREWSGTDTNYVR